MTGRLDPNRLETAYRSVITSLMEQRTPEGHWTGELSTSALSTATAISALAMVQKHARLAGKYDALIRGGIEWLSAHQNEDGGWGDTTASISNISTSMLCRAAAQITGLSSPNQDWVRKAEVYLDSKCGKTPQERAEAIRRRYGKDRTFSVPILTVAALAGMMSWNEVPALPFELACLPQSWYRFARLPVVSYALPALLAIGRVIHHHRPTWNPLSRLTRGLVQERSMSILESIQPDNGGFLEAVPLTSFATISLACSGKEKHPVTRKGSEFIVQSVRSDGSWPIDTNLATWTTTLTCNALASVGLLEKLSKLKELRSWLLQQQFQERHRYTGADPGGWGWTNLPGSVPDADDTPGVLLTLRYMEDHLPLAKGPETDEIRRQNYGSSYAIGLGLQWLLGLQNRDGGWPTFCRGWGTLPFDRSGPDLTAHAIRALHAWVGLLPKIYLQGSIFSREYAETRKAKLVGKYLQQGYFERVIASGLQYLARTQRKDGSWLPLWFGNQYAPNDENPTYGTARVLAAYRDLNKMDSAPAQCGVSWLLSMQNDDGGWGGTVDVRSSIEETALALEVLLSVPEAPQDVLNKGLSWLVEQVEADGLTHPTPIGFYFAKLWYFEKLYPMIFAAATLGRAVNGKRRKPTTADQPPTNL